MVFSPVPTVYELFVGVDIAATTATVASQVPGQPISKAFTIDQTLGGFEILQRRLLKFGYAPAQILVVMEATGSYWLALATTLAQAGFTVSVVNAQQAHHFAKALVKRAKTDAIDAQMLAELAARLQPAAWTPPPTIDHELQQRLAQRDTLISMRQQMRNQLHALQQQPVVIAAVRQRLETFIATFTEQIGDLEAESAKVLGQDDAWAIAVTRLQTITGIGLITATWLVVATLNFSTCPTPEAAVAYAGLAPREHQSGTSVHGRGRIGHTGNARLRTMLYLASLSAAHYNPVLRPFYERLVAAGKSKKLAHCAVARKLVHIAWAVATKGQPFDPLYQHHQTVSSSTC